MCRSGAKSPGGSVTGAEGAAPGGGRVELAFSLVRVELEARPRGAAHALHVSLGSLCLKDCVTEGTLFPIIAAPQVPHPFMFTRNKSCLNSSSEYACTYRIDTL